MLNYENIGKAYCECDGCSITELDKEVIERDLRKVYYQYKTRLNIDVVFLSEGNCQLASGNGGVSQLRDDVWAHGDIYVVEYEGLPIDNRVYAQYRALHDILSHVFLWRSFSWQGEYESWLDFDRILCKMECSQVTRSFVRYDILYKNALYHYCNGNVPEEQVTKVVLEDLTSCQ